jgi:hypothetical protein
MNTLAALPMNTLAALLTHSSSSAQKTRRPRMKQDAEGAAAHVSQQVRKRHRLSNNPGKVLEPPWHASLVVPASARAIAVVIARGCDKLPLRPVARGGDNVTLRHGARGVTLRQHTVRSYHSPEHNGQADHAYTREHLHTSIPTHMSTYTRDHLHT